MASKLKVLAGSLIVAALATRASANCLPNKSAGNYQTPAGQYVYWIQPPGYSTQDATLKGRFWQLGNRAAGNEGLCTTAICGSPSWLYFYSGDLYMTALLGSPEVAGCPTGRLITVVENVSTSGADAAFLVGTVDENPNGPYVDWNYSVFGIRSLVPIPKPQITSVSRMGVIVTVHLAVDSAAAAAFGPSGAAVITGYKVLHASGAADPGRSPALYTPVGTVNGSAGGPLSVPVSVDCSTAAAYHFAVQVLFDSGVASQYVGAVATVACALPCETGDTDGDGYYQQAGCGTSLDCNDGDPAIHPGAVDSCNNVDDDCDGAVDEGLEQTRYRDADGDGYGNPSVTLSTCFLPAGWVTQAGDCDDAAASVHPGAAETCNAIDDNCNALVDEDGSGVDSDADTVRNACDNCRFVANPTQIDSDGDHVGNACDNCINTGNANQSDADADGRGDACDNCLAVPNGFQDDTDADRVGDACDNCPLNVNASQSDVDNDGEGDVCDVNDGLIYVYVTDKNYREWQSESGYTAWNSYRGSLAFLRATGKYTQAPGSNAYAARDCGLSNPYVSDLLVPNSGEVAFHLATGVVLGVESGLGTNSAGVPRANTNPCP